MSHAKRIVVFILLLTSIFHVLPAQEPVVVKPSRDRVVIQGKTYFIHVVKKGETLFSISRAYNVPVDVIIRENPGAETVLSTDQALKIPAEMGMKESGGIIESDKYIYHVLEPGQTFFFLSRHYQVDLKDLREANPDKIESELSLGTIIRVPKAKMKEGARQEILGEPIYVEHRVRRRETLYSISRKYNVPIEDIVAANPEIADEGLKWAKTYRIPVKTMDFVVEDTLEEPDDTTWVTAKPDLTRCNVPLKPYIQHRQKFQVALLVPFFVADNFRQFATDSLDMVDDESGLRTRVQKDNYVFPRSVNFLEFYEGALIAIDSLRRLGFSVDLHVYDTERDTTKIKRLLTQPELKRMDLIIGPFYTESVEIAARFARENKIPLVSPLSTTENLLYRNPYVLQINPSIQADLDRVVTYLLSRQDANLILIHNPNEVNREAITRYRDTLRVRLNNGADSSRVRLKEFTYHDNDGLSKVFEPNRPNVVIVPSTNEVFVTRVMTDLFVLARGLDIQVLGMPAWTRYSSLDIEYFHRLQYHYLSPFYIDLDQPAVRHFVKTYKNKHGIEPYRLTSLGYNYAMLGHDIAYYFLSALGRYGKDFPACLPNHNLSLLQSNYHFLQLPDGGYMNRGYQVVRYEPSFHITTAR